MSIEPQRLAMFPLSTVLFPGAQLPLHIFETRFQALTRDVLEGSGEFGVVLIDRGSEVGGGESRVAIGTRVIVEMATPFSDGRWLLVTRAIERIRVVEWLDDDPYPRALVESMPSAAVTPAPDLVQRTVSSIRRARGVLSEMGDTTPLCHDLGLEDSGDELSWHLCALAPLSLFDAQALLEESDPTARLEALMTHCADVASTAEALLAAGDPGIFN